MFSPTGKDKSAKEYERQAQQFRAAFKIEQ
jgi:hypothetical protein